MADYVEAEIVRIRRRLLDIYTSADADRWLNEPQIQLDGANALDLIEAGQSAKVDMLLDQLDIGTYR